MEVMSLYMIDITCLGDDSNVDDNVNVTENTSYEEMGHGLCSDDSDNVISHVIVLDQKEKTHLQSMDREIEKDMLVQCK